MPRFPDFHAPAGTFLGSWCWHSVPSLGMQLEGGTTDKLAKDSGDEKRKSVRDAKEKAVKRPRYNTTVLLMTFAPGNRSTFELSHTLRRMCLACILPYLECF